MVDLSCEICGQPGTPSWGDAVLCENCYGTIGATCAGRPRTQAERARQVVEPLGSPATEPTEGEPANGDPTVC